MAGNYVDYPNHRFALDLDGTQMYYYNQNTGVITQYNSTEVGYTQDEDTDAITNIPNIGALVVLFPEKRDLTHWYCATDGQLTGGGALILGPKRGRVQTSVDTTNGLDGTWVTQVAQPFPTADNGTYGSLTPKPWCRTAINAISANGIQGIRFWNDQGNDPGGQPMSVSCLHLFGTLTAGENPKRLEFWHPTLNQRYDPAFDWGNAPRGSSADFTFRVKNHHSTLTANNILLSLDAPSDTSPSVAGQHTLSNGGSFAATQTITSLAPGAISGVHTLRRVTPTNATLWMWMARLKATPASWT